MAPADEELEKLLLTWLRTAGTRAFDALGHYHWNRQGRERTRATSATGLLDNIGILEPALRYAPKAETLFAPLKQAIVKAARHPSVHSWAVRA